MRDLAAASVMALEPPPRIRLRPNDMDKATYIQRATQSGEPGPVPLRGGADHSYPSGFLGPDGVHPSAGGMLFLVDFVREL